MLQDVYVQLRRFDLYLFLKLWKTQSTVWALGRGCFTALDTGSVVWSLIGRKGEAILCLCVTIMVLIIQRDGHCKCSLSSLREDKPKEQGAGGIWKELYFYPLWRVEIEFGRWMLETEWILLFSSKICGDLNSVGLAEETTEGDAIVEESVSCSISAREVPSWCRDTCMGYLS